MDSFKEKNKWKIYSFVSFIENQLLWSFFVTQLMWMDNSLVKVLFQPLIRFIAFSSVFVEFLQLSEYFQ